MLGIEKLLGKLIEFRIPHIAVRKTRVRLQIEALEERWCPAGTWVWTNALGTGLWSNAGNWTLNGGAVPGPPVQQYPGGPGSNNDDVVIFNNALAGPATLNVPIGGILSLTVNGWNNTLFLNTPLTVTGALGSFQLLDTSTINMLNPGANLTLQGLGLGQQQNPNVWSAGTITGGANTAFIVSGGSDLNVTGTPAALGTQMNIGMGSLVTLANMTGNLPLTGANNYIDVSGLLQLNQQVAANRQNLDGGISTGILHNPIQAVQIENTGVFGFGSQPLPGVQDEVVVQGAVYNLGGTLTVGVNGDILNLAGKDTNGRSYWQQAGANAALNVSASGANITAAGTFQIDAGTVYLTAQSNGVAALDNLDGAGLLFGNANNTTLEVTDSKAGVPGQVNIGEPVTLAASTTVIMNFSGGNNTADLINVLNGALTLAGTLQLNSVDGQLPSSPLLFFEDTGATPSLVGSFTSYSNNIKPNATYNSWIITDIPNDYGWELSIS